MMVITDFSNEKIGAALRRNIEEYGVHKNTLQHALNDLRSDKLDCHHAWFHGDKPKECQGMRGSCCCAHCCTCG